MELIFYVLGFAQIFFFVCIVLDIYSEKKEEKEFKKRSSEIIPGTYWSMKKLSFEKDNNPFFETKDYIYKVMEVRKNNIGIRYLKYETGVLLENGDVIMEEGTNTIQCDDFAEMCIRITDRIVKAL